MPTSATRISSPRAAPARGFTLVELLVVVVLVATLMGTVILGFTGADTEQRLKGHAEHLAYTIEMARQYALQRNREWGLYVEPDAVEFAEFDPEQGDWVTQSARPFGNVAVMDNVTLRVESEEMADLPSAERDRLPKVIIFSSGEVTPFTVHLQPGWDTAGWEVASDGLSRVSAQRVDF